MNGWGKRRREGQNDLRPVSDNRQGAALHHQHPAKAPTHPCPPFTQLTNFVELLADLWRRGEQGRMEAVRSDERVHRGASPQMRITQRCEGSCLAPSNPCHARGAPRGARLS